MDAVRALIVAGHEMMTFSTNTQCIAYQQAAGLGRKLAEVVAVARPRPRGGGGRLPS